MKTIIADKIGSASSPLRPQKEVLCIDRNGYPEAGDVVLVRALTESVTYGNIELPTGRLAKINSGDILMGVLGRRRALKGFVGDVPAICGAGDKLHLLNMGAVIGVCSGHHSSLSDAIQVEVLGFACDDSGQVQNIKQAALPKTEELHRTAPLILIAGSCMNSGKTVAAAEIIKQAHHAGLKVAAGKLSGIAALRDTLNMVDHGAILTASFLDCGMPSTVGCDDLAPMARSIVNHLNAAEPDLIVLELGDGIVGGYSVESILRARDIIDATASFVFCAPDYVGVIGGRTVLAEFGITIDVVAGSVTDSQMGEDFVRERLGLTAGNARRDGRRLFHLVDPFVRQAAA